MIAIRTILPSPVYEVQIGQAIHGLTISELLSLQAQVGRTVRLALGESSYVAQVVSADYNITPAHLIGRSRMARHTIPRHISMWILKSNGLSYQDIADSFGNRDHGTAMSSVRYVINRRSIEPGFKARTDALLAKVNEQLERKEERSVSPPPHIQA